MHLLVLNEFFWPDVCASSAVLTDHLPRIRRLRPDWRITVLTGNRAWDKPDVTWPPREPWNGIDIVRVPRPAVGRTLWRRGLGFLGFHRGVLRIGRTLPRPGVIMSSTAPPCGSVLGSKLATHFRCRHVYRVLDLYPDCATTLGVLSGPGGSFVAGEWRRRDEAIMSTSAAVVAIAQGIAARIRRTRRVPADRVCVIHDGFDPERVRPMEHEHNAFRREQGLEGRFVVQYAGNMGLSHPFETLLAAAKELIRSDERIIFQFIGAGPGRAVLQDAYESLGDRVQVLDYQPAERLAEVLGAADVALISQDARMAELSLPYKFYGILAAGRPFVFVGSAASEIVTHGREAQCGLHVEQGDAAGLVAALRRLAGDSELRAAMGRRARELFEARFTSDRAAHAWIDLIERIGLR